MSNENKPADTITILVLALGAWGKGKTYPEALSKCVDVGGRQNASNMHIVYACTDPECSVTGMSRNFSMNVEVDGFAPRRRRSIVAACCRQWSFQKDDFSFLKPDPPRQTNLTASADGQLCGGETESEFADRLAAAVWSANGAYCGVTVRNTYLDDLPYCTHTMQETDYRVWRRRSKRTTAISQSRGVRS
jgi:hypothetical protein